MARILLLGAGHAVLGTLYSRAHRIALHGVSCLLEGLRKNLSFGFFVVVVVCVVHGVGGERSNESGIRPRAVHLQVKFPGTER